MTSASVLRLERPALEWLKSFSTLGTFEKVAGTIDIQRSKRLSQSTANANHRSG